MEKLTKKQKRIAYIISGTSVIILSTILFFTCAINYLDRISLSILISATIATSCVFLLGIVALSQLILWLILNYLKNNKTNIQ